MHRPQRPDEPGILRWLGDPDPDGPTLVLLHGHGSSAQDLISVVPALRMLLPDVRARVVAVQGTFPAQGRSRGHSWFPGSVYQQPPAEAVALAVDRIAGIVRRYAQRAVVLGFSQGMCAAVTLLRRHPQLVTAVIGLSGFVFDDWQPGDAELSVRRRAGAGVPAFFGYDPGDPVVPTIATNLARRFLDEHTALQEHRYPGIGHGLGLPEISDVAMFLAAALRSGSTS